MKGTANSSLQQDTGELPLTLRREELRLKLAVKLSASTNNPAKSLLTESWEHSYGKYKNGMKPFFNQVNDYLRANYTNNEIEKPKLSQIPPWQKNKINVNTSLTDKIKKSDNPVEQKIFGLELINTSDIYTDGSCSADNKISAAYCVPSEQVNESYRITDSNTILTAELIAIRQALKWVKTAAPSNYVLFSDSLSSLKALTSEKTKSSRPNLIQEIQTLVGDISKKKSNIELAWIPSHVGITGNEMADRLAKEATNKIQIDELVKQELN